MSFLQSEILLAIFKNLDSKEMLNIRTVSQFWLQVIDENKTLWRTFNPPIEDLGDQQRHVEEVGEDEEEIQEEIEEIVIKRKISTLELFDRKSQSSLQEVTMDGSGFRQWNLDQLVEILSRSNETLRILKFFSPHHNDALLDLSWRLPHLVDCRLLSKKYVNIYNNKVRLIPKTPLIIERDHYKVLWIVDCERLFGTHLHLLDNLVSLKVETWKKGFEWRSILDKPSRTLKHLAIKVQTPWLEFGISYLVFPALQVLEISSSNDKFPSWFRISSPSFTLINNLRVLSALPSISTLWVEDISSINAIENCCPELMVLRANVTGPSRKEREERAPSLEFLWIPGRSLVANGARRGDPGVNLIQTLEQRKRNIEDGMEIDGIKMKQLKTLIVPFGVLDENELKELRRLVEEVIDLKTSSTFVDVEI